MSNVTRIKPRNFNPDNLADGELLPCIGGPLDGATHKVALLFGVLPSGGFTHGKHSYRREGRKYIHCDPANPFTTMTGISPPKGVL